MHWAKQMVGDYLWLLKLNILDSYMKCNQAVLRGLWTKKHQKQTTCSHGEMKYFFYASEEYHVHIIVIYING